MLPEMRTGRTKIYILCSCNGILGSCDVWGWVQEGLSLWELLAGDSALLGRTGSVGGSSAHFPAVWPPGKAGHGPLLPPLLVS